MALPTIDINNLPYYSDFISSKGYTVDTFIEFQDVKESEWQEIEELQILLRKPNKTPEETTRLNVLSDTYRSKMPTSSDWNKFCACLVAMESFIKTEVWDYIEQKKAEIVTLMGQFDYKGEFNPTVQYYKFNQVKIYGNVYQARKDTLGNTPSETIDTEFWLKVSQKGDQGIKGDRGNDGINFVHKGLFSMATTYQVGQSVGYNGSAWGCIKACSGVIPTEGEYWTLIASKGSSTITVKLNNYVSVTTPVTNVQIGISNYNSTTDDLTVHKSGILMEESIHYTKNSDGISIDSVNGELWENTNFSFTVYKNINVDNINLYDGSLIMANSITRDKLDVATQNAINDISNKQDKTDNTLTTADKTITGGINEVNEHLGDMTQVPTISKVVSGAIAELFTNVSNGKALVGTAITDVDNSVVVPTNPTFQNLADAIGQISTGKKWASGTNLSGYSNKIQIPTLNFLPTVIIAWNSVNQSISVGISWIWNDRTIATYGTDTAVVSSLKTLINSNNPYLYAYDPNIKYDWIAIE